MAAKLQRTTTAIEDQPADRSSADLRAEQADFARQRDAARLRAQSAAMSGHWAQHGVAMADAADFDSRCKALESIIADTEHGEARVVVAEFQTAVDVIAEVYQREVEVLTGLGAAVRLDPSSKNFAAFWQQGVDTLALFSWLRERKAHGYEAWTVPRLDKLLGDGLADAWYRHRGGPYAPRPTPNLARFNLPPELCRSNF